MSRIGKQAITIPNGVTVTINGSMVVVKGPKGELKQEVHPVVKVTTSDKELILSVVRPDEKEEKSVWGLMRTLIANMIVGVTEGFFKKLEVIGVGYKVVVTGKKLVLNVGYSHPVEMTLPEGIEGKVEKNTLTISGIDKQLVGEISAQIRRVRKPEPYKGKGIRYIDEVVRRKAGKTAKSAA